MKKIKALISFCGVETMAVGEVRDVSDSVADDLIACGYAEEIKNTTVKKGDKQ